MRRALLLQSLHIGILQHYLCLAGVVVCVLGDALSQLDVFVVDRGWLGDFGWVCALFTAVQNDTGQKQEIDSLKNMANIVGVGIAALDIINITDGYPVEDSKIRALAHKVRRGGNTANTLSMLSQLGHHCSWCGTIGDDTASEVIVQDLQKYQIDISYCKRVKDGFSPTSYITLNQQNGSRTIVHYRDLPEYAYDDFILHDFTAFDWIHFEGRNIDETSEILAYLSANYPGLSISLEVEKSQLEIEKLFPQVQLLFFSRQYALNAGYKKPEVFLSEMAAKHKQLIMVCSWGDQGACAVDVDSRVYCSPAMDIGQVVDTIGAGDTFHAGFIDARVNGCDIQHSLRRACRLAGIKCGQYGFDDITL